MDQQKYHSYILCVFSSNEFGVLFLHGFLVIHKIFKVQYVRNGRTIFSAIH